MITQFVRRQLAASGLILAFAAQAAFGQPAAGQPAATGTTASQPDPKQQVAEFLLTSINPGSEAARYTDVMDAITRAINNDGAGAQALLEKAAKQNPKLPPSEVMIARLLLRLGQPGPGRTELEKAVVAHPNDPEAYLLFAEGALQDGRVTDADALLDKAKSKIAAYNDSPKRKTFFDSHLAADLTAVAVARAAAGASDEWNTAVDRAKEWVKADPDSAQAHQQLGRAVFKQMAADYAKNALNEFQKAAEKDKNATHPYIILAQLYQEAGKDKDAETSIKYALDPRQGGKDLSVNLQAANWALSTSTQENKRLDDAGKYADAAMAIDPKSLDAKVLRAVIARLKGDPTLAEKLLKDVVEQAPGNVAANNQLALVLIELADLKNDPAKRQQAIGYAENNMLRTTQGNQFSPEVFATYAWVLYKSGEKEKAGQYLDKVLSTKQLTPDMAYYVGKILQDSGKTEQAIQFLESALKSSAPFAQRDASNKLLAELQKQKEKDDKDKKGTEPTSTPASK
jgi:tetratricopeptide (TPR) repeat protein